ncbi:MAG: hypothetical protein D6731_15280 [Planctomycetota bacterium]|nr:MAG: hypothetical protein D6731_15280 [Planctomycetota bacterium]
MEGIVKGLMVACIGLSCYSLAVWAPRGSILTRPASPEPVRASPGAGPGPHTRGPRYVFVGGFIGGK